MSRLDEWNRKVPYAYRDAGSESLLPGIRVWANSLTDHDTAPFTKGNNLVLTGPVGTGKTYQAFAVCCLLFFDGHPHPYKGRLLKEKDYIAPCGFDYWSIPNLLAEMRTNDKEVMKVVTNTSILVLDDIGSSRPTEWSLEQLYRILDVRRSHEAPVIATTNQKLSALDEHLGPLLYSRLVDGATVIEVLGKNRRK